MKDVSRSQAEWSSEASSPAVAPGRAGPSARRPIPVAAGLLALSAALHIATVFPAQGHGIPAFDDHAYLVVQQAVLAVGWLAAAAGLVARGRPGSVTAGAALGAGIASAELGIVVSNLAEVLSESTAGAGAWLFVAAWAVGLVGAVAALVTVRASGPGPRAVLGRPVWSAGRERWLVAGGGAAAAIVVGVALLPAWDHYVITSSVLHRTLATQSLGNAFAAGTPGGVLTGDLLTAIAFALVPLIAMWWRPGRVGVALSGGVLVVVVAQLASAVAGYRSSPSAFGITAAQVSTYGVRVHSSLTSWFVVELLGGAALLMLVLVRWFQAPDGQAVSRPVVSGPPGWAMGDDGRPFPVTAWGGHDGGWGPPVPRQPDPEYGAWARPPGPTAR